MTDRAAARIPLPEAIEAAVAGGVDRVQVRERALCGAALLDHVQAIARAARRGAAARSGSVAVVMNRRVDVALAADLDGVHLGFDALAPEDARPLLGPGALLGVSTHSAGEIAAASALPIDYVQLAPIFDPLSKKAERPPLGLEALAGGCGGVLPVIAQGGIDAGNAAACLRAGAHGIAVTGAILGAIDPQAAAQALRAALTRPERPGARR